MKLDKRVLVVGPGAGPLKGACSGLVGLGCRVKRFGSLPAALLDLEADPCDLLLATLDDDDEALEGVRNLLEASEGVRCVFITPSSLKDILPRIVDLGKACHLIASNQEVYSEEVVVTARKILANDIFGIEHYLLRGVEPERVSITDSRRRSQVIDEVGAFASRLDCSRRMVRHATDLADEMVTNALYNAPVDENGSHRYRSLSRSEHFELAPHEAVEVSFACDGRFLALGVADPFGSLTAHRVLEYLARCFAGGESQIDEKKGGAGLGLFKSLSVVSSYVINISPGRRTETIGLFDLRLDPRAHSGARKSFHLFKEVASC